MDDPDKALIQQAKAGSSPAFGQLIKKHYDLVYAVVFGILRNREEALDVTQDVFLKLFHDLQKFEGQSKFKSWLYRVAANAAIDHYRKKRPTEPVEADSNFETREMSPREAASRHEIRQLIEQALGSLNAEQRAVFVLREWNELSYEEIAETLQIEIGTVMSRLFYARKKLAQALGMKLKDEEI